LLLIVSATGCGSACRLSEADAVADAKEAIAQGDLRLVGYMGIGMVVPGTPLEFQHWTYAPGVKVISNVTDTSPSGAIEEARAYATRYNQIILCNNGSAP
jgi:hypothetical protein